MKSIWRFGAAGNIVKQHIDDEGVTRFGTKAFTGGTKVYINGLRWDTDSDAVYVIGRNRFGRYVTDWIPVSFVENVRFQQIYKTTVLEIIDYLEHFEGITWWDKTASDRDEAKAFVDMWNKCNAL